MYKINKIISDFGTTSYSVIRLSDNACIPSDPANTDYASFKKEINRDEAELRDADGNTLTAAEAKAFVATLP